MRWIKQKKYIMNGRLQRWYIFIIKPFNFFFKAAQWDAPTHSLEWWRLKQLTKLTAGQDGEHWYIHTWSRAMESGTIPLEVCLTFSSVKHMLIIQTQQSKSDETYVHTKSCRHLLITALFTIIKKQNKTRNNPNVYHLHIVVYSFNVILLSSKKQLTTDAFNNFDKLQNHQAE